MNKKLLSLLFTGLMVSGTLFSVNAHAETKTVGLVINAPANEQTATNYFNPKNNTIMSSEQSTLLYNFNKKVLNTIVLNSTSFAQGPYQNDQKTLYVFFDPQCDECDNLWKTLQGKEFSDYRVLWIPVSVVAHGEGDLGLMQAATIIYSKDPLKALAEHEKLFSEGKSGIVPSKNIPKSIIDRIRANTYIYNHQGFQRVPALFHLAKNGQIQNYQGESSLNASDLIDFMND